MTKAFDDRLITLTIQIEGETFVFDQNYYINAVGEKYAAPNLGIGEVRIDNIDKNTRDFLVSKTSLYNTNSTLPVPAILSLDVGRKSYGTFRLFTAQVIAGNPTQPPDIGLTLRAMTGAALLGLPLALTMPPNTLLSGISAQVAQKLGLTLSFQATDKNINNYSFTGGAAKQLQKLQEAGNVDAFIDNTTLIVKDSAKPRLGPVPLINQQTGMVGIPLITERGVSVTTLINNEVLVGGQMKVESDLNPAATGTWNIFKLGFEISSWEVPFYWTIEANNNPLFGYAA